MTLRTLILTLLFSFSCAVAPGVFADELGTGTPSNTSNTSQSTAPTEPATQEESALCEFWETVRGWFE